MAKLKVYADRMSQPSRAVLIFCKYVLEFSVSLFFVFTRLKIFMNNYLLYISTSISLFICSRESNVIVPPLLIRVNGIDFDEVRINLSKGEHRSPQFKGDPDA